MVLDLPAAAADLNELSIENEGISPPETSEGYPDYMYIYIHFGVPWPLCLWRPKAIP